LINNPTDLLKVRFIRDTRLFGKPYSWWSIDGKDTLQPVPALIGEEVE
jgi:hypothetical protein